MKRILISLMLVATAYACGHVNPDTYKREHSNYSRDDGLFLDSSNNMHFISNGSTVGNMSTAGVLTAADLTATDDVTSTDDTVVGDDLAVTGLATVGETLAVTGLTTATGGLKTEAPLFLFEAQHFCGQGANGTTATYIGPVKKSAAADETTYVYGAAGCDGLDNTTEATADAPLDYAGAIEVVGMACTIGDGGTDDLYTFQLRDDTADVADVTCGITLDGAGVDTCAVILSAPVTVAAGSTMAVKQVAATDDNCSACDTECLVYFTRTN